jgi:hypothetical protein
VTNSAGGLITGASGIYVRSGAGAASITNSGGISGTAGDGVALGAGGSALNNAGASITGTSVGVAVYGAAGTVTNSGTISGPAYAVRFASGFTNRLIVTPGAVFNGAVGGGGSATTLELQAGASAGAISGINNGSFLNFGTVQVDSAASWNLAGSNNVATFVAHGTAEISGSLDVSGAVDPASDGVFRLDNAARLEVASALGTNERISFAQGSQLTVDNASLFGVNIGTTTYGGPLLQSFGSSDVIDLLNFGATGASSSFDTTTGLLQLTNGAQQNATLKFETASLGPGAFQTASDGGSGILVKIA